MQTDFLAEFTKSGSVTTNDIGIANVVFRTQLPNNILYSVLLTCKDPGQAAAAYVSNETQTGFTITTKDVKLGGEGYAVIPTVTVYWLAIPQFNS